jgi:hypothetical protein
VAARYHTPEDAAMTLEKYMELCAEANAAEFASSNYEAIESEDKDTLTLGGAPALKNTYKIDYDGVRLLCFQITTKHKGDFISLYGYCPVDKYEARKEDFDLIRENLKLGEKSKIEYAEVVDKSTPEGMKLASNKKVVLYSLYVPSDWTVAQSDAMTLAYVSEQNKSSVSVMQWNLTEQTKTIDLWWSDYHKKELQNSFDTFTVLEEGIEGEIDGIASKSYTYTVTISGTTYKYYVTAVIDQGSIHLITYTSTEALYDETLSTVKDQILANMKFN